jgi:hypothetical protein
MPIRPELRQFYTGPAWRAVRARILERAGHRCESCLVPNHKAVLRMFGWWTPASVEASVLSQGGWINGSRIIRLPWTHASETPGVPIRIDAAFPRTTTTHWVGIVLTVAHLNHVSGDDRDDNLKALCQWCHLHYDRLHHKRTRSERKDSTRPILQEVV